jgi:hypothetical protein
MTLAPECPVNLYENEDETASKNVRVQNYVFGIEHA